MCDGRYDDASNSAARALLRTPRAGLKSMLIVGRISRELIVNAAVRGDWVRSGSDGRMMGSREHP